jgi:hypothetical protein
MFMRYFHLAILATTAASVLSQSTPEAPAGDMARQLFGDWDIQPEDGFPQIAFNASTESSEVLFKYNFTGALTPTKFLGVKLYQSDCTSPSDASLNFTESINVDELDVDIAIIQSNISKSVHYKDTSVSTASIGFCLRVDYNYTNADNTTESVNFHETNVTITIDLTAGFTLTGITTGRTNATTEDADAKLDYAVEAYICLDNNTEVTNPDPLAQGSILQVCIKIDDELVSEENIRVEEILTFVVSQPGGEATDSIAINNGVANIFTDKICREGGVCNVKTQLLTKFFTDNNPSDLRVEGVAVLAFGKASIMPSSAPSSAPAPAPVNRRLRAPIRGLLTGDDIKAFMATQQQQDSNEASVVSVVADTSQRMLQAAAAQSEFGLEVGLQASNGNASGQGSAGSTGGGSAIVVATIVLIMLAAGCGLGFFFCTKRRSRKEEKEEDVKHHSSAATVATYPSQRSVYSSSSGQYDNYQARDQQID